ncbi:hypothetical protein [Rubritalea marina]|uniref:hypothetical protein n=1 Tax=Rubritalea marina TaxID=361055 RepID=UPI00037C49B7|nr:hypothetical protein [Rubritalea marina]
MKLSQLVAPLALGLASIVSAQSRMPEVEQPPSFRASEILPPELIKSSLHRIREHCPSDGFMIHFQIDTNFGEIKCHGMNQLAETINELRAIKSLATTSHSDSFAQAMAQVSSPPEANTPNAPSLPRLSVSHFFQNTAASSSKNQATTSADNSKKSTAPNKKASKAKAGDWIKTKLRCAKTLGINPYTSNSVLQRQLDKVSWVFHNSNEKLEIKQREIPSNIASLMDARHTTGLPNDIYTKTPSELLIADRNSLLKMGAPEPLIDGVLLNIDLSTSLRHSLIEALKKLPAAGDRFNILGIAADCTSHEQARYLNQVMVKLAAQHKLTPYQSLTIVAKMPAGITADGHLDVVAPVDYISWTPRLIEFARTPKQPGINYRARIFGQISPTAKAGFQASGWTVITK